MKNFLHSPQCAWLLAFGYMGLIWTLSSFELPDLSVHRFPLKDKGVHFVEYGVLGFLLTLSCLRTWAKKKATKNLLRFAILGIWVALLWGVLDELHQAHVPGRSADVFDIVADGFGATFGAFIAWGARVASLGRTRRLAS